MLVEKITNRLGSLSRGAQDELRLAQEQAFERIHKVLFKAETEVARTARFMSAEQRFEKANSELAQAEGHLLSALSSIYKALCYAAPHLSCKITGKAIKEVQGVVRLDSESPKTRK